MPDYVLTLQSFVSLSSRAYASQKLCMSLTHLARYSTGISAETLFPQSPDRQFNAQSSPAILDTGFASSKRFPLAVVLSLVIRPLKTTCIFYCAFSHL